MSRISAPKCKKALRTLTDITELSKVEANGRLFKLFFCRYTGPKAIKLFSCSTQLITEFQRFKKLKYRKVKKFFALTLSDGVLIMLINVKIPTIIVGILTFMSRINFVLN